MTVTLDTKSGMFHLGPATGSAVKRLVFAVDQHLKSGEPIPRSEFAKFVARRITSPTDKQDYLFSVSGPRGSGKSYSCLYILERISFEISQILGGSPTDYFDPQTDVIALEDSQQVTLLLASKGKHRCILLDDFSVFQGNHDWMTKQSKNMIRIFTTMRTRRWCICVNAPQNKNLDIGLRDFLMLSMNVVSSYHQGGFNLLRANTNQISTSGKTYRHKLKLNGTKMDLLVALKPKDETVKRYDITRELSAERLNDRIAATGVANVQQPKVFAADRNLNILMEKFGDRIIQMKISQPKLSQNKASAILGISYQNYQRVIARLEADKKIPPKGGGIAI